MSAASASPHVEEVRENANQVYRWGSLIVSPRPSESMLAYAFLRFEKEELLPWIFYEGVPKLSEFLATYSNIATLACFRATSVFGAPELIGLGWTNSMTMMGNFKKAEVGMAFFKHTPRNETMGCAQMMIDWSFEKLGLSSLFGSTPVKNRAACLYMQRLGFSHFGPVEAYCTWNSELCAVEISCMTHPQWQRLKPFAVVKE